MSNVISSFNNESGVGEIRFNRPNVLNAINVALARDIADALSELARQPGLRCLVLRGEGRAFMAGGDVGDFVAAGDDVASVIRDLLSALNPVVLQLRSLPCPVLAVAHGAVAGAGLSLLAACDLVIAANDSRYLMAYDKIGAPPDCGGSAILPLLVGERRANELMFGGAVWTAAQAQDYGLVNRVCEAAELDEKAAAWTAELAAGPTQAFAKFKALRNARLGHSLAAHLDMEGKAFEDATATADFREGITAFAQRRKAEFKGE